MKGDDMNELMELLRDKLGWLESTRGAKHVSVKLDASQLARIMSALGECENPALPKIEPRMLNFRFRRDWIVESACTSACCGI